MKVLFVISSLNAGGAERVTTNLANYWGERKNWDVTIVTLSDTGSDFYQLASSVRRIRLDPPTESKNIFIPLLLFFSKFLPFAG